MPGDVSINVASIVSGRDFEPYVQVEIVMPDGQRGHVQITPLEARRQALFILQAADASEADHFLMTFAVTELGSDSNAAAGLLHAFREYRERRRHTISSSQQGGAPS